MNLSLCIQHRSTFSFRNRFPHQISDDSCLSSRRIETNFPIAISTYFEMENFTSFNAIIMHHLHFVGWWETKLEWNYLFRWLHIIIASAAVIGHSDRSGIELTVTHQKPKTAQLHHPRPRANRSLFFSYCTILPEHTQHEIDWLLLVRETAIASCLQLPDCQTPIGVSIKGWYVEGKFEATFSMPIKGNFSHVNGNKNSNRLLLNCPSI